MKKRLGAAAAVTACVLALSGCTNYGTDMPEKYSKFLDYTFNDDYSVELKVEETYNDYDSENDKEITRGYRRWQIDYSDTNGYHHQMELYGSVHEKTGHKEYDKSIDDILMFSYTMSELRDITSCELYNKVVKKYFDAGDWQGDDNFIYQGNGLMMQVMTFDVRPDVVGYESNLDLIKPVISPKSGVRLADCTLASEASRKEVMTFVRIYVFDFGSIAEYTEAMNALIDEYVSYVGSPQNYHFDLHFIDKYADEPSIVCLVDESCFLGEKSDLGKDDGHSLELIAYEDYLLDKLGYERAVNTEE